VVVVVVVVVVGVVVVVVAWDNVNPKRRKENINTLVMLIDELAFINFIC
jgi:hypothetical protein